MTAAATHCILLSNTCTLTNRLLLPTMLHPEGADMRLLNRGSGFDPQRTRRDNVIA
jgi:hypothetical protein